MLRAADCRRIFEEAGLGWPLGSIRTAPHARPFARRQCGRESAAFAHVVQLGLKLLALSDRGDLFLENRDGNFCQTMTEVRARPSPDLSLPRGQRDEPHPLHGTFSISCIEPCVAHRGVSQCSLPWTSWKVAGRSICGRPLYRSPDGNTVTIELFNRGAATWAAGRSGSSGARTAYTVAVSA